MTHINVEIKAICHNTEKIREILHQRNAEFKGLDEQEDIYFSHANGRLKLRLGKIENNLIHYFRDDKSNPKISRITLMPVEQGELLKKILADAYGIEVVVRKKREIYFIDNVKFHIDNVAGLGEFIEIEAIDSTGERSEADLREQCEFFMKLFGIKKSDLIHKSYSDMLINQGKADEAKKEKE